MIFEGAQDFWLKPAPMRPRVWPAVVAAVAVLLCAAAAWAQAGAGGPVPSVVGSQYLATPNAVADKQLVPMRVGNDGTLYVNSTAGGGTQDVNLTKVGGATVATGHGTAAGTIRVELPTDGTGVVGLNAGSAIVGKVGIDQTTPGTTNGVQVNAALPAGSNVIGHVIADTGSTTAVTQATASNLNATVVGTGTFATQAVPTSGTTGGATASFLQPTASDNHANIKNGAGTLYGAVGFNNSVTINYLRYYNAGTGFNGCNSATNLIAQFQIPPSGGYSIQVPVGIAFTTGLSICVTSGYATTDTTNATASAMSVTTLYN